MGFKFIPEYRSDGNLLTPNFPVHNRFRMVSFPAWAIVANIFLLIVVLGLKFIK